MVYMNNIVSRFPLFECFHQLCATTASIFSNVCLVVATKDLMIGVYKNLVLMVYKAPMQVQIERMHGDIRLDIL